MQILVTALAAVKSGAKGIYAEKPMAQSLEEADAMVGAGAIGNVKLVVGAISVCHPAFGKAREFIEQGTVGELVSMVCLLSEAIAQHNVFLYLVGSEATGPSATWRAKKKLGRTL